MRAHARRARRYCRFYQGRRTDDDERQVGRWKGVAGEKGRWKRQLVKQCVGKNKCARARRTCGDLLQPLLPCGGLPGARSCSCMWITEVPSPQSASCLQAWAGVSNDPTGRLLVSGCRCVPGASAPHRQACASQAVGRQERVAGDPPEPAALGVRAHGRRLQAHQQGDLRRRRLARAARCLIAFSGCILLPLCLARRSEAQEAPCEARCLHAFSGCFLLIFVFSLLPCWHAWGVLTEDSKTSEIDCSL